MFTISNSEKSTVRSLFEQHILYRLFGFFESGSTSGTASGPFASTVQGDDRHVDRVATVSIFFAAALMLITPLWILAFIQDIIHKLIVITIFSVLFLIVMNWGTVARAFEILASTAG